MEKAIKILALTSQQIIISELVEVAAIDIGAPDCKLINPFVVKENNILEPFLLSVTKDDTFMISSDKILTIADPMPTLLEKYLDLVS